MYIITNNPIPLQNKCFPYWPQPDDPPMEQDKFQIEYVAHEDEASYRLSHLKLENLEVNNQLLIIMFQTQHSLPHVSSPLSRRKSLVISNTSTTPSGLTLGCHRILRSSWSFSMPSGPVVFWRQTKARPLSIAVLALDAREPSVL